MPFQQHKTFISIDDENKKLWRYLSLSKFISLLQTKSLFFSNVEQLVKDDPFEGALPLSHFIHREWKSFADIPLDMRDIIDNPLSVERYENLDVALQNYKKNQENMIDHILTSRKSHFINCWHVNSCESYAMWEIYADRNEGIAIKTSEHRLQQALHNESKEIYGGLINYRDFDDKNFKIDETNAFNYMLTKRSSYSYENEYRLIYKDWLVVQNGRDCNIFIIGNDNKISKSKGRNYFDKSPKEIKNTKVDAGILVNCDLSILIEDVYVSPLAQDWFKNLVEDLLYKYGLKDLKVQKSKLLDQPPK